MIMIHDDDDHDDHDDHDDGGGGGGGGYDDVPGSIFFLSFTPFASTITPSRL